MYQRQHEGRQVGVPAVKVPLWLVTAFLSLISNPLAPAFAHTGGNIEMVCPYDGTKFTYYAQGSGTSFDKGLDFMPIGMIMAPWPIASCPTNGFVFLQKKYTDEELERLRPLIFSPEFQALKGDMPYYRAAWIREHTGASHSEVSWTLLQATWEAREQHDFYQRYAKQLVDRLPEDIAAAKDDKKLTFQMLRGELFRRLGRFDEAKELFTELRGQSGLPEFVGSLVAYQIELISKHDSGPHAMGDAKEDAQKQ